MVVLFPVGIPAMYAALLWRKRARLRDADQRDDDRGIRHLAFLWQTYKPEYWWFEVFECGRKLALTTIAVVRCAAYGDA